MVGALFANEHLQKRSRDAKRFRLSKRLRKSKRLRQPEQLEARQLFAGIVQIDVVGGNLVAIADDHNNSFDVVAARNSEGIFRIVPDRSTAINDFEPGSPVTFEGVSGGLRIKLAGGDDRLRIIGSETNLVGRVQLDYGEGNDQVRVQALRIAGYMELQNPTGISHTTLSNLHVNAGTNPRAISVRNSNVIASDLDIAGRVRIDLSPVEGRSEVTDGEGRVRIRDVSLRKGIDKASPLLAIRAPGGGDVDIRRADIDGPVRVEMGRSRAASRVGLGGLGTGKAIFRDVAIRGGIDKASPKLALAVLAPGDGSEVELRNSSVEGNVRISVGNYATLGADGSVSGNGEGRVRIQDVSLRKGVDKASPLLAIRAPGGGDVDIRRADIDGPVRVEMGRSRAASRVGLGGLGTGKAIFRDVAIRGGIDKASPKLALAVLAPGDGSEVELRNSSVEGNVRISVGNYATLGADGSVSGNGEGRVRIQDVSLRKGVDKASPLLAIRAPGGGDVDIRRADIDGPVRVEMGRSRAASRVGLGGLGTGKAIFRDVAIRGGIDKASPKLALAVLAPGDGSEVELRNSSVEGNVRISVGNYATLGADGSVSGNGEGRVRIQDVSLRKGVDKASPLLAIRAPGGGDVDIRRADIDGPVRVEMGRSRAASRVGLGGLGTGKAIFRDVAIRGGIDKASPKLALAVLAPGDGSEVELRNSSVEGNVRISVGNYATLGADGSVSGNGEGRVRIQDVSLRKGVDKASPLLAIRAPGGGDVDIRRADIDGPVRVEMGRSRAASRVGLGGLGTGKAIFRDVAIRGGIDKASPKLALAVIAPGDGSEVELRNSSVEGNVRISVGNYATLGADGSVSGNGEGRVRIQDVSLRKGIDKASPLLAIRAPGGGDVDIRRSDIDGRVKIEQSGNAGNGLVSVGQSSMNIHDSYFGSLEFQSEGLVNDHVRIVSSIFEGQVALNLGDGDDRLTVRDSVFASQVMLDGGAGFDSLSLRKNRFLNSLLLEDWER